MIIDRHCHGLLCTFLTYHILIQSGLDLMRCRNIFNIQLRKFLWFLFFLLDLFCFWLHSFQIRKIQKLHSRHIHHFSQIQRTAAHRIKASLHTVRTHRNMVRKIDHLPGHTLRSVTDKADLLVTVIILTLLFSVFDHFLTGILCPVLFFLWNLRIFFFVHNNEILI